MQTTDVLVRGIKIILLTHTRSLELCARMNYETENLDFIDSLPVNSVFYDLGACEGRFSIYAALRGLKVFAFEPEQNNYTTLISNIRNNNLEGIISAFQVAVGDSEKVGTLKIGQPWAGGHQKVVQHNQIRQDLNFDFKTEQAIKMVALDDFIRQNTLPKPDYIKIDVDGSEMPFIKGSPLSIKESQGIIFELDKTDLNYLYIIDYLEQQAFKIDSEYQVPNEPNLYNVIFLK